MTQAYILPAQARDELLRYLGNRPYREVATGFQALLDLKPLDGDPKPLDGDPSDPPGEETSADG